MSVTREKLYEEIWAEPATKVAPRYGVSANFLARVCDRLRVPRPERGYWAQLAVGKALQRPALPAALPGDELEWSRNGDARRDPRALPAPPVPGTESREPVQRSKLVRHEMLAGAREHISATKQRFRIGSDGYQHPTKRRLVDVFVSLDAIDSALAFANTLFLALQDRGHRVTFAPLDQHLRRPKLDARMQRVRGGDWASWEPDRPTVVYIGTVAIGLTIFELSQEMEVKYVDDKPVPLSRLSAEQRRPRPGHYNGTSMRYMPTGKLCLRATSPYRVAEWEKHWREEPRFKLLPIVPQIVTELEAAAVTVAKLVEEGELKAELERRKMEEQHAEWQRRELERQRQENIKNSRDQLFGIIEAWGAAKQIEGFFEDLERRAAEISDADAMAIRDRAALARQLLGGVDALQRFRAWRGPDER